MMRQISIPNLRKHVIVHDQVGHASFVETTDNALEIRGPLYLSSITPLSSVSRFAHEEFAQHFIYLSFEIFKILEGFGERVAGAILIRFALLVRTACRPLKRYKNC